jgi:hypothetical protein
MAQTSDTQSHKDQQHPLWAQDRVVVSGLLSGDPSDYNLAELARLIIRYRSFPGARDIQADLQKALEQWSLTESELFERTRQIHAIAQVYKGRPNQREDWS